MRTFQWMKSPQAKAVFVVAGVAVLAHCGRRSAEISEGEKEIEQPQVVEVMAGVAEQAGAEPEGVMRGGVAKISARCIECHQEIGTDWAKSHHGLANRMVSKERDGEVFAGHSVSVPGEEWKVGWAENTATPRADVEFSDQGDKHSYPMEMAIGETPLIQYLTNVGDGRWQTSRVAWDSDKKTISRAAASKPLKFNISAMAFVIAACACSGAPTNANIWDTRPVA